MKTLEIAKLIETMSTSDNFAYYMSLVEVEPRTVALSLRLILNGTSPGDEDYYGYHPTIPGATYLVVSIDSPIPGQNKKGKANLIRVSNADVNVPPIDREMLNYPEFMFSGYKLYIQPEHLELGNRALAGDVPELINIGLIVIKGKGGITFFV